MARADFTEKERKIIQLTAQGLAVTKIAEELGVSKADVCQTLKRIANKIKEIDDSVLLMKEMGVLKETATIELTPQGQEFVEKIKKNNLISQNRPDHKIANPLVSELETSKSETPLERAPIKREYADTRVLSNDQSVAVPKSEPPKIGLALRRRHSRFRLKSYSQIEHQLSEDLRETAGHPFIVDQSAQTEPTKLQSCPQCNSSRLERDYENAEISCMNCGLTFSAKITDRGPELSDEDLSTTIYRRDGNIHEYYKGPEPDRWHWMKNCKQYPRIVIQKRSMRPNHDLCTECLDLERIDRIEYLRMGKASQVRKHKFTP